MPEYSIPSNQIMLKTEWCEPIETKYFKRRSPLLVSLLQEQSPCAIINPMTQINQTSKRLLSIDEEAKKRERRRRQNREAAKRLKQKRETIENNLSQTIQVLQTRYSSLQDYIEQLQQRKQHLLNVLNQELYNASQLKQYSVEMNLFDDSFEEILDAYLQPN